MQKARQLKAEPKVEKKAVFPSTPVYRKVDISPLRNSKDRNLFLFELSLTGKKLRPQIQTKEDSLWASEDATIQIKSKIRNKKVVFAKFKKEFDLVIDQSKLTKVAHLTIEHFATILQKMLFTNPNNAKLVVKAFDSLRPDENMAVKKANV